MAAVDLVLSIGKLISRHTGIMYTGLIRMLALDMALGTGQIVSRVTGSTSRAIRAFATLRLTG